MAIPNEDLCKKKKKLEAERSVIDEQIKKIVMKPENIVPFLVPGRVIRVKSDKNDFGWGIVVNFTKQRINAKLSQLGREAKNREFIDILKENESHIVIDVYLFVKNKLSNDNVL